LSFEVKSVKIEEYHMKQLRNKA